MTNRRPPGPDDVLARISALIEPLYEAAERGTTKAQQYEWPRDERSGRPLVNRHLAPSIARFEMLRFLSERAQVACNDEFDLDEEIPNNGICFTVGPYCFRILKAYRDGLPSASSNRRRDFYCQNEFAFIGADSGEPWNFAILWVVNPDFSLNRLMLACPLSDKQIRENGKVTAYAESHWMAEIQHPSVASAPISAPTTEAVPLSPAAIAERGSAGERDE